MSRIHIWPPRRDYRSIALIGASGIRRFDWINTYVLAQLDIHRRRASRTASDRFEVAMQSAFQRQFSYTIAVWGLLDGGSVMVCWMRVFAVANKVGRGGVSVLLFRHSAKSLKVSHYKSEVTSFTLTPAMFGSFVV